MTKKDIIANLHETLSIIRKSFVNASIDPDKFVDQLPFETDAEHLDILERFKASDLKEAWHWLEDIYNNQFANFKKIWNQLSPDQWQMLKQMESDAHYMDQFRKAAKGLRDAITSRERPDFFQTDTFKSKFKKIKKARKNSRGAGKAYRVIEDVNESSGDCIE